MFQNSDQMINLGLSMNDSFKRCKTGLKNKWSAKKQQNKYWEYNGYISSKISQQGGMIKLKISQVQKFPK